MSKHDNKLSMHFGSSRKKASLPLDFSAQRITQRKKMAKHNRVKHIANSTDKWLSIGTLVLVLMISLKLTWPAKTVLKSRPDVVSHVATTSTDRIKTPQPNMTLRSEHLAKSLLFVAGQNDFPNNIDVEVGGYAFPLNLEYTINEDLQKAVSGWLDRYDPDFAVVVALNPENGQILALSTHVRGGEPLGNLAMSSAYPAASVFKIITAAAAIDLKKLNPASIIPFNGKSTHLYKKQVLEHQNNRWTRKPTLKEAFAKSINPVFGQIGLYTVGGSQLKDYAKRFYFDSQIKTDLTINPSLSYIPNDNDWAVVEAASGYTNKVTLSPIHAAAVAASIINGGQVMRPYLVKNAYDSNQRLVYKGQEALLSSAISPKTANQMQVLMEQTVTYGTAKKSFRNFFRGEHANLKVGGKTGSLMGRGDNLNGQNDWFVGYAYNKQRKLAFAILNVNRNKWKVKSHYLAKKVIDYYFDEALDIKITASRP